MLNLLRFALPRLKADATATTSSEADRIAAPDEIFIDGLGAFGFADHLTLYEGLPFTDWAAVREWISTTDAPELQSRA